MPGLKFDIFNPDHQVNMKRIWCAMDEANSTFFTCINHHPDCAFELGGACVHQLRKVLGEQASHFKPPTAPARVGVVACCKTKMNRPAPARSLYQSHLFKLSVAYLTKRCSVWVILSAKHGVVMPDDIIEPYDLTLADMTKAKRDSWATKTNKQLLKLFGDGVIYTAICGLHYRAALRGFTYMEQPTSGLTLGRLKQFLNNDLHGKRQPKVILKALGRL